MTDNVVEFEVLGQFYKGDKGDPGVELLRTEVVYQVSNSSEAAPSGEWLTSLPIVPQGSFLWVRVTLVFNSGDPVVYTWPVHQGLDGSGSVSSVNNVWPDPSGDVKLSAKDVQALALSGGALTGQLDMGGFVITNLGLPVNDTDAARRAFVVAQRDAAVKSAKSYVDDKLVSVTDEEIERLFKNAETIAQELYKISPSVILEALGGYQNVHVTPFPVGAVYISVTLISPSEVFGGTWERIEDRFLLAAGTKYAAGATGGEWEHTLTVDEIPSHGNHIPQKPIGTGGAAGKYLDVSKLSTYGSSGHGWTLYGGNEAYPYGYEIGGSQPHNITPPFLAVYVWKRVA